MPCTDDAADDGDECDEYSAGMDESGFWFLGGASSLGASMLVLPTVEPEWLSILTVVITLTGAVVMFARGALDWRAARHRAAAGSAAGS